MLTKLKSLFLESFSPVNVSINLDRPVFTFTFDDVPLSAATNGANLLENVNANGTYYVSLSFTESSRKSTDPQERKFIGEKEIVNLHERGHDIACHTYSHINLRRNCLKTAIDDCEKNTKLLSSMTKDKIKHFSYPFGTVGPMIKRALSQNYLSLRATDPGINNGKTDLSYLKAINIYSQNFDKLHIKNVIKNTVRLNGWTIFYTHDVEDNTSQWGTTKEDFEWVVNYCKESNADILSIDQAIKIILGKF